MNFKKLRYNSPMIKDIKDDVVNNRGVCYSCYRPVSSCMCKYVNKIDTKTKFVILMHPKEYRKTKNGTGHFTHLSLPNSHIFIGIDFTNHKEINKILEDKSNNCYILYPGNQSINLNTTSIKEPNKTNVIFIIDSTWACSKKMIRESKNITDLPKVSFSHTKSSAFKIKTQPQALCLSTMESTLCVLELLDKQGVENISNDKLQSFLEPFTQMVSYQVDCATNIGKADLRYKKPYKKP